MTIGSQVTSQQLPCNGTATQFTFPNKIFSATDLIVTLIDLVGNLYAFSNGGSGNVFTNTPTGLSYTVFNVDVDTGCYIVFSSPPTNGWTCDLRTQVAELQTTSIKNQGSFLPELHEEFFDRITREAQDLTRLAYTYSVHGQDIESIPWAPVPLPALRKGMQLMFDVNTGAFTVGIPSAQVMTQGLIGQLLFPQTASEIAANVIPSNFAYVPGDVRRYGLADASLVSSIAQAQQPGGATVLVASSLSLANSNTVPYGVSIEVQDGTTITIAGGQTLTINGPLRAQRIPIFFGAGAVILGAGSVVDAYPEWWGAVPNATVTGSGTDSTAALTAAITACSGGAGSNIGLVPMRLGSGYYLTGNLILTPAFTMRGTGRKTSGIVAKNGTTGILLTDNGNAAGIILEDFAQYGNSTNCPGLTNLIEIGYGSVQHGSEGYFRGLWPRDCACSGSSFAVDINANVGFYDLISVYGNVAQSSGSSLLRVVGAGNMFSRIVCIGAGANAYSAYFNAAGSVVRGLEIEAPGSCSASFAPLSIQQSVYISGCVISVNNAANTTFDHLVEIGVNAFVYGIEGLALFQASGAFLATVSGGNLYNIAKTAYFGGTLQAVASNQQGSGSYTSGSGNALSGTVTFAAATTAAVILPWGQTVSNYKVQLGGNAAGFCWVTAKTASGFTINCSVSNSNTTDWSVTL